MEKALALFQAEFPGEPRPAVRWLPFQLNPDMPPEGVPRREYMERKFGAGSARGHERLTAIGRDVGIEFDFDAIGVQPNTADAHRLLLYAEDEGRGDELAEALFRAYFQQGVNIGDRPALVGIGSKCGLECAALERYLDSESGKAEVRQGDVEARQAGIGGVPFFIFNRRIGVSGAQDERTLLEAMKQALEPAKA